MEDDLPSRKDFAGELAVLLAAQRNFGLAKSAQEMEKSAGRVNQSTQRLMQMYDRLTAELATLATAECFPC